MTSISVKELRKNLATIANRVHEGESFAVYRRSKLAFKIVPPNTVTGEQWDTVVDFTQGSKTDGLPIEDALKLCS